MNPQTTVLITAWRHGCASVAALLDNLGPDEWAAGTDCPDWTVRDIAAHLAAIEHELATGERPHVLDRGAAHPIAAYTQAGVDARADLSPAQIVAQFRAAVATRDAALTADPPQDLDAAPDRTPGGIAWDWRTLLRNRVIDVWVHEQDIRRATARPGGLDGPAADLTVATFTAAVPFVIGRQVRPPVATTVAFVVGGTRTDYVIGDTGRCEISGQQIERPDTTLTMSVETLTIAAAGRRPPADLDVQVDGDRDLAARILAALPVTP